jgi:hypothetical protein
VDYAVNVPHAVEKRTKQDENKISAYKVDILMRAEIKVILKYYYSRNTMIVS